MSKIYPYVLSLELTSAAACFANSASSRCLAFGKSELPHYLPHMSNLECGDAANQQRLNKIRRDPPLPTPTSPPPSRAVRQGSVRPTHYWAGSSGAIRRKSRGSASCLRESGAILRTKNDDILRMLRTRARFSPKLSGCSAREHDFLQNVQDASGARFFKNFRTLRTGA